MKKKIILASFLIVLMAGHQSLKAQQSIDSVKTHLNFFLDQWHRDAAEGNHTAYIGAMTSDGVFIGTDATKRWTTPEFSAWSKPNDIMKQVTVMKSGTDSVLILKGIFDKYNISNNY